MLSRTRWLSSKRLLVLQISALALIAAVQAALPISHVAFAHPFPAILGRGRLHLTPQTSTFRANARQRANVCLLRASGGDSNEEGRVSNSEGTGPSPEDWRAFRANLIARESDDGNQTVVRSVAKKNEELLRSQNPKLAEEYLKGAWAHVTGRPEVGGLMTRLPIEAQLAHLMQTDETSEWGQKLSLRLEEEIKDVAGVAGTDAASSEEMKKQRRESWAANTAFMYKLGKAVLREGFDGLASKGKVSLDRLKSHETELLELYTKYQDSWQEVCLILDHGGRAQSLSKAVVINRPIRVGMDVTFASIFLNGQDAVQADLDSELLLKFVMAFGREGAFYLGGPQRVGEPGLVVHGIQELEGAVEVAPGTGIYSGGLEGAVKGVLEGRYKPLDFRFFLGCREWEEGGLERAVGAGEYQSVACARPIALKQCLGLPKPLWHEVMELCGGQSKELSRLEILQREDLDDQD